MAQLPPVLSLLLALLYVCCSDLRKRTNSKHLYKAEIEWDLLFRPQSSGGSYSEGEAYAVLEELAAILATFRPQVLIPVKRTKKAYELASSDPTGSCRVDITPGPTSCAAYEGASELTSFAPAGSCGLGIAYRALKNVHYPKKIIYYKCVRFPCL